MLGPLAAATAVAAKRGGLSHSAHGVPKHVQPNWRLEQDRCHCLMIPRVNDHPTTHRDQILSALAQSRQAVPDISACTAQNGCDFVPRGSTPMLTNF